MIIKNNVAGFLFVLLLTSCGEGFKQTTSKEFTEKEIDTFVPEFNPDSAYYFIQQQVDIGPRVPNTETHKECVDFLVEKLKGYCNYITIQNFEAKAYNDEVLNLYNIIASFNPEKEKRILLASHFDTRPFADKDTVNKDMPIDGANDGGSGTGVLLEIARILSHDQPDVGVDIIFFDGEDYGEPEGYKVKRTIQNAGKIWWCLGSQYWAKNMHKEHYVAYFGILLDMVGAKNATFYREGGSMQFAKKVVKKVWKAAHQLGYEQYFISENCSGITDDHIFVNRDAKIPMINVIDYDPDSKFFFADYHHTHRDNMQLIDKNTLKAVGETVLYVLFQE